MLAEQVLSSGVSPITTSAICGTGGSVTALGTNQATAAQLPNANNIINVAAASTGVRLPPANPGSEVWLYNTSGQTVAVFPFETAGVTVNGAASVNLATAKAMVLKCFTGAAWASILTA